MIWIYTHRINETDEAQKNPCGTADRTHIYIDTLFQYIYSI